MAGTGIRVFVNTQAPLTLPGTLSTAEHCDQSIEPGAGSVAILRIRSARLIPWAAACRVRAAACWSPENLEDEI